VAFEPAQKIFDAIFAIGKKIEPRDAFASRVPDHAANKGRAARTRVKIMQPEKDVIASKVSRAGGRP
jgi:hypothetical protein